VAEYPFLDSITRFALSLPEDEQQKFTADLWAISAHPPKLKPGEQPANAAIDPLADPKSQVLQAYTNYHLNLSYLDNEEREAILQVYKTGGTQKQIDDIKKDFAIKKVHLEYCQVRNITYEQAREIHQQRVEEVEKFKALCIDMTPNEGAQVYEHVLEGMSPIEAAMRVRSSWLPAWRRRNKASGHDRF
jgi:hypothetical protein